MNSNSIPDYSCDHNPFFYFEDTLLHGSADFGYDEWWPMMPLQSCIQVPYVEFLSFDDIWGDFAAWDQAFPQVCDVASNDNVVDVQPLISAPGDTAAYDGHARIHQAPVESEKFHQSGATTFDGNACFHQALVKQEKFHQNAMLSVPGATASDGLAHPATAFDGLAHVHQTPVDEEIFPQSGAISVRGATPFDGHTHIHQTPAEKERLHQSGATIVHGDMAFNGHTRIHEMPVGDERFHQSGVIRYSTKSSGLLYEEIRKYFDVPISTAAKELKVGVTVLKKRCRELNIRRWPHRKIKSLSSLIQNAKDLGLTSEVATLEEHKRMIHKIPELELCERTKKLRQACFKANYKKRRALGMAAAYQNY